MGEWRDQVLALGKRLSRLEHRGDVVVNEAKAAALSASHEATHGAVMDLARRIGKLEARDDTKRIEG